MISSFASGSQACTVTTEHFLSAPAVEGEYRLELDLEPAVDGDVFEVRVYKIVLASGAQRQLDLWTFYGDQAPNEIWQMPRWYSNELTDADSLEFSIKQTFGTSRTIPWKLHLNRSLAPTTAARSLDVSAGGEAGLDWANIGSEGTAHNLSSTAIDTDQVVASVSGAVGSVVGAVGSVTGAVGSVTGAVGSIAAGGISAASFAADAITAAKLAADVATEIAAGVWAAASRTLSALGFTLAAADLAADTITAAKVAADVGGEIADAVWDEAIAGHLGAGSTGAKLNSASGSIAGSGALTRTLRILIAGAPVQAVAVWVSSDASGATVVAGTLITPSDGTVTVLLDAGTYYLWARKDGMTAILGTSFVVS